MEEDTGTAADSARERGETLVGKLAGYPGPSYRKAYLSRLLRSGLDFLGAGNTRSAQYCLGKVESELAVALAAAAAAASVSPSPAASPSAIASGDPGARQALDRVRARWREERIRKAEAVLDRHGPRLSSLERKVYRENLVKWSLASRSPAAPGAETRADSALQELRRRLYGRILKTQKADMARRTGSVGRRLGAVHEQYPGPVGPYNDRHNLEGVITVLTQADSAWVEEFLELYRGLASLRAMLPGMTPS